MSPRRVYGRPPSVTGIALLALLGCGVASLPAGSAEPQHEAAAAGPHPRHTTWSDFGGGPDQSRFVADSRIDRHNVARLEVAWFYPTGDENVYQFNPLVVDGVMYVLAQGNSLVALDAATGEELWIHAHLNGISRRGVNHWRSPDGEDRRILFQMNDYLQAIDARTGRSILGFGKDGLVDLREGLDRDPGTVGRVQSHTPGVVFENLILLGSAPGEHYLSAPGHLRAYDVVTGELVWTFRTIPHPGEYGYETWPPEAYRYVGGVNTWGEISLDVERGIAYFPTGSPTYDYYGADRHGQNLFGNSLLALDARTGRRLWHFQAVHHDLWDYDLAAAPQLVTVRHGTRVIDAVAVATKHGFLFAFDRATGEPLWPIEQRPVAASHVPGEQAWPTQPFPTVLPPFARQAMTAADVSPFLLSPAERAEWAARIERLERDGRTALFTPLSDRFETLALPGAVGGASWGNTAADPERGIVYVFSIDWPSFYPVLERGEPVSNRVSAAAPAPAHTADRGRQLYQQTCFACHGTEREGTAIGPPLIGVERRLSYHAFRQIVAGGQGEMPAFGFLAEDELRAIHRYLGGTASGDVLEDLAGPVVARGGAPGGQELRRAAGGIGRVSAPYPDGIDAPPQRYAISGWGLGHSHVIAPPWSSIVAYDLNRGTIRWKRPLGLDRRAGVEGGESTGVPRSQRHGMIVTSTGLVFSTARDGRVYALDADDGRTLWSAELPMGTEGLPAMYQVNGRQYLVVTATTPLVWAGESQPAPSAAGASRPQGGYVVFALPE
jgi:quinoprotein glucose dehydrogenase